MSLIIHYTSLLISLYLPLTSLSKSSECQFSLTDSNNVTSNYDLSQFYFPDNYVHEVDDKTHPSFAYKFNICGSIPKPLFVSNTTIPSYCLGSDKGPCIDFAQKNGTVICNQVYPDTSTQVVPSAVQIVSNINPPECYWLGMELSSKYVDIDKYPNYKVDLIDTDNSGAGIVFTILNGQFCSSGDDMIPMNRQLSINLQCPDSTKTEWDTNFAKVITESVVESPTCVYQLTFESPLACPKQCITFGSKKSHDVYAVCSTHGICAADPNAGYSRCICDNGFGGDLCEKITSGVEIIDAGNEDLMTAIIICIVITAICCGIAVYLWYHWRQSIKIDKMLENTHEYFLNIDDEVEEDDDTINVAKRQKQTRDTFHPVLSADVETAMIIHEEHRKQSLDEQKDKENENDGNEIEGDGIEEDHQKNIANYVSDPDEEVPDDDEIDYVE